jgi:hypothetical protein
VVVVKQSMNAPFKMKRQIVPEAVKVTRLTVPMIAVLMATAVVVMMKLLAMRTLIVDIFPVMIHQHQKCTAIQFAVRMTLVGVPTLSATTTTHRPHA